MEFRVLKYFLAVARHENITKAAEELHLTQPTLSRQLGELEAELGTELFVRGKRRTTLTEEGLYFKSRAEEIVRLTEQTAEQFAHPEELVAGDIYIGCGETEAMRDVIQAVAPLRRSYPRICLHFISGDELMILDQLQKGLLDFGVLCRPTAPLAYAFRKLPHVDRWGLVMREDNPLAQKEAVSPQDLAAEPLLLSQQVLEGQELDHWLKKPVAELNVAATYNLHHNALYMVDLGLGSLLTFAHLSKLHDGMVYRPLIPEVFSHNFLIWRKDRVFTRAGRLIQACFEAAFSS